MYKLKLTVRECISCGICMDVCEPEAIKMHVKTVRTIEGPVFTYMHGATQRNPETTPLSQMTFPFMANPMLCNGCLDCVDECPTSAIQIALDGVVIKDRLCNSAPMQESSSKM